MCVQCVYGKDFHEMHSGLRGPNDLFIFQNLISLVKQMKKPNHAQI